MGRKTREKQKIEALKVQRTVDRLAQKRKGGKKVRGTVLAQNVMTPSMIRCKRSWLKNPNKWQYKGKSKRVDRQRTEFVRYIFGNYHVPKFLEEVWNAIEDDAIERERRRRLPQWDGRSVDNLSLDVFVDWYIAAAQGKSLYKLHTRGILSKKETHLFLQAPNHYSCKQALWWAKAVGEGGDVGVAHRIANSAFNTRFDTDTILDEFWISVMRFFVQNPVSINEMNNLFDYLMAEHRDNVNFKMKGRSLESIRRKSEEWHRLQIKQSKIGGGTWEGMPIETWTTRTGKKKNPTTWTIEQINTGNALLREGQRMRHCVSSYKRECMEGRTAIFSMSSVAGWKEHRNLTIEVSTDKWKIVQVAGFGNRRATNQEKGILHFWAREHELEMAGYV